MAGPALARLRIELEADSASLEQGLERAKDALKRAAAIGVAAGTILADAMMQLAGHVLGAMGEITDVTSETFQKMSTQTQRAALLVGQSMEAIQARSASMVATITDRVLPGIAALAERFANLDSSGRVASVAIEVLVFALKGLVTGGALVISVFEALGHIVAAVAQSLMAVARGDFQAAYDRLSEGAHGVANEVRTTFQTIRDIWAETEIAANRLGPAVLGPWTTIVQRSQQDVALMRQLREEMAAIFANPASSEEEKIAAAVAAHAAGAISVTKFEEAKRKAYLATQQVMESSLQAVGRTLTAVFDKSKPAAIAQALINTFVGISQAIRLPFPLNWAQASAVAATGFAQVRNIQSTSSSGGGGAASAPAPSAGGDMGGAPSQTLMVQGMSGSGMVSMLEMRALTERLLDFQRDGGTVVLQ